MTCSSSRHSWTWGFNSLSRDPGWVFALSNAIVTDTPFHLSAFHHLLSYLVLIEHILRTYFSNISGCLLRVYISDADIKPASLRFACCLLYTLINYLSPLNNTTQLHRWYEPIITKILPALLSIPHCDISESKAAFAYLSSDCLLHAETHLLKSPPGSKAHIQLLNKYCKQVGFLAI